MKCCGCSIWVADRSTLSYRKAQEQTPEDPHHNKMLLNWSQICWQTHLRCFICSLEAFFQMLLWERNILVTSVCSQMFSMWKQKQGSFIEFVFLMRSMMAKSPHLSFPHGWRWICFHCLLKLPWCSSARYLSLPWCRSYPFSDLAQRDSPCSLMNWCSTLIRYKKQMLDEIHCG